MNDREGGPIRHLKPEVEAVHLHTAASVTNRNIPLSLRLARLFFISSNSNCVSLDDDDDERNLVRCCSFFFRAFAKDIGRACDFFCTFAVWPARASVSLLAAFEFLVATMENEGVTHVTGPTNRLSLSNGKAGRKDTTYRGPEEALTMTNKA